MGELVFVVCLALSTSAQLAEFILGVYDEGGKWLRYLVAGVIATIMVHLKAQVRTFNFSCFHL
jgi:hypothetical protein